jgi:electron-transferring-flavoprotein dehydrogenase
MWRLVQSVRASGRVSGRVSGGSGLGGLGCGGGVGRVGRGRVAIGQAWPGADPVAMGQAWRRYSSAGGTGAAEDRAAAEEDRAVDHVDVCIVGGGPAGLATAIRLKQLDDGGDLRVVLLEKAADFGAHIVSGAVVEPAAFNELFPDSEHLGSGVALPPDLVTRATRDEMCYLTEQYALSLPEPPQMRNAGANYIVSLNAVVKHLAEQAEELGVELYPGVAVSGVVEDGGVRGVVTQDMGRDRSGAPKATFERGMEFRARATVLAEGCHGLLTKQVAARFGLRDGRDPQTYGLGIKEVWEVEPSRFEAGRVAHTLGFPLADAYGGGFMYHFGDGLVAVGLVVGLDYANPYLLPYQEFQRMKTHPFYRNVLEGGKCVLYAARALNEGGLQSVPRLAFPGGVLVGCGAGFLNVPKIKGTHTAVRLGILAAELIYAAVCDMAPFDEDAEGAPPLDYGAYQEAYEGLSIYRELEAVRNVRPAFGAGLVAGLAHSALSTFVTAGAEPWTLLHRRLDAAATEPAARHSPIDYPKPDGKLTFDLLTLVLRTGTHHDEDEPCHLRVPRQDLARHAEALYPAYAGIEQRFCPAGVYEYVEDDSALGVRFQINSQNCIHCKTCDIKVPAQDITWTVPEGGDGPKYYMT